MKTTLNVTLLAGAFIAGVFVSSTVSAQTFSDGRIAFRPYYGSPHFYSHASTYEEGVLRGWADVWRGVGEYNYHSSLANINNQEAYSRYLDNSLKHTQTFFARRELNKQARQSEQAPRPSAEDLARFAKERAPQGLTGYEYSAPLGSLNWPAVLEDPAFAEQKAELDRLFATRTTDNSGLGSENHRQITRTAEQLVARLKSRIGEYSPSEYMSAKSFLNRLERESLDQLSAFTGVAVK
jgi:hypothetical protein